ncbi:MAG: type II toxin-antitoxin system RelE/ParE family toxin [Patescibacteria group bacterium]
MQFQLRLKPSAQKELDKLEKTARYKVLAAFSEIAKDPFVGKKLEGEFRGCYSYRVWPFRIIYLIYKKELLVLVIRIGHRQGVY